MAWQVFINCECDGCGRNYDDPQASKHEAWQQVSKDGWKRIEGKHLCYECVFQKTGKWTAPFMRDPDDIWDSTPPDWSIWTK